jgi:hypothetical protein
MPTDETRETVNAQLRRLGFPEIPPPPTTKQEKAADRLRRRGLTPARDQQPHDRRTA